MQIQYGFKIEIECVYSTPVITMLDIFPGDRTDGGLADEMQAFSLATGQLVTGMSVYLDVFGNLCRRMIAPAAGLRIQGQGMMFNSGAPDRVNLSAPALPPEKLPDATLQFLLGSRYCETDLLCQFAWDRFSAFPPGWQQVQAICDFVHGHIRFDYSKARSTRTAAEGFAERTGVCRDFAHLAITLCRCLNIPARYCTGYLGDIGQPPAPEPMDFSAWFEVFLGGEWWTFDARHNVPRIGRMVIARGRDAADVPIINSFGPHLLRKFEVITLEAETAPAPLTLPSPHEISAGIGAIAAGRAA